MTLTLSSTCRGWIAGLYRRHTSTPAERVRLTIFLGSMLMVFAIRPATTLSPVAYITTDFIGCADRDAAEQRPTEPP